MFVQQLSHSSLVLVYRGSLELWTDCLVTLCRACSSGLWSMTKCSLASQEPTGRVPSRLRRLATLRRQAALALSRQARPWNSRGILAWWQGGRVAGSKTERKRGLM